MDCVRLYDSLRAGLPSSGEELSSSFSILEYLDTEEAVALRDMLERWFRSYPKDHREQLRKRIRSLPEHESATFELCFHEILTRLGYWMIPHPPLVSVEGHPDFLCCIQGVPSLYIELYQRWGPDSWQEEQRELDQLAQHVNRVFGCGDFFIQFRFKARKRPTAMNKIAEFLHAFIQEHDVDKVEASVLEVDVHGVPARSYVDGDCEIVFELLPRDKEERGRQGDVARPILDIGGWLSDISRPARRPLAHKATKYQIGSSMPFILVLDVQDPHVQSDTIDDILFGDRVLFRGRTEYDREANGLFSNPEVSAVVVTRGFGLRRLRFVQAELVHNPWSAKPYSGPLCSMNQVLVRNKRLESRPGRTLPELLGL